MATYHYVTLRQIWAFGYVHNIFMTMKKVPFFSKIFDIFDKVNIIKLGELAFFTIHTLPKMIRPKKIYEKQLKKTVMVSNVSN